MSINQPRVWWWDSGWLLWNDAAGPVAALQRFLLLITEQRVQSSHGRGKADDSDARAHQHRVPVVVMVAGCNLACFWNGAAVDDRTGIAGVDPSSRHEQRARAGEQRRTGSDCNHNGGGHHVGCSRADRCIGLQHRHMAMEREPDRGLGADDLAIASCCNQSSITADDQQARGQDACAAP